MLLKGSFQLIFFLNSIHSELDKPNSYLAFVMYFNEKCRTKVKDKTTYHEINGCFQTFMNILKTPIKEIVNNNASERRGEERKGERGRVEEREREGGSKTKSLSFGNGFPETFLHWQ